MEDLREYLKKHTIKETLETYELTWQELIHITEQETITRKPVKIKNPSKKKPKREKYKKRNNPTKYIQKTYNDKYKINKNGEYYGTYDTLETAQLIKEELEKRNWNKEELDTIRLEKGIIRYIIRQ